MVLMVRLLLESMEFIFCYFSQYILAWSFAFELIQFPFCFYFSCCWSLFQFSLVGIWVIFFSFPSHSPALIVFIICYLCPLCFPFSFVFIPLSLVPFFVWPFVSSMLFDEILGKLKLSETYWCARITFILCPFFEISGTQFLYMLVGNSCILLTWFRTSKYIKVMDERCINNWTMPSIHHCKSFERGIERKHIQINALICQITTEICLEIDLNYLCACVVLSFLSFWHSYWNLTATWVKCFVEFARIFFAVILHVKRKVVEYLYQVCWSTDLQFFNGKFSFRTICIL